MKRLLSALLLCLVCAAPALAADRAARPQRLTQGGADPFAAGAFTGEVAKAEALRIGKFSAGSIASWDGRAEQEGAPATLRLGGYVEYGLDDGWKLDGSLRSGFDGGLSGEAGISQGGTISSLDTDYVVRLGAEWGGDSFTPAQALSGYEDSRDINLSLTLSHSITPNFTLSGTAAAKRMLSTEGQDAAAEGSHQFLFGAGLGYRF